MEKKMEEIKKEEENKNVKKEASVPNNLKNKLFSVIRNKKKLSIMIGAILGIIVIVYLFFVFAMPTIYYSMANSLSKKGKYESAVKTYQKCSKLKKCKENIKAAYFGYGKQLIKNKKYKEAIEILEMSQIEDRVNYIEYANALLEIDSKNYDSAIKRLNQLKDFEESKDHLVKANYLKAEKLFAEQKYSEAKTYYDKALNYKDAKEKSTINTFMIAETKYKEGNLNGAKKIYVSLPANFEYNKVKVKERLNTLNKYKKYLDICGTWKGTNGKMIVRQTHDSTGLWDEWTGDYTDTLNIKCIINSNGTVTIKGSAKYYIYTNYSSLSKYLKTLESSITINKTGNSIPTVLATNGNTQLTYSGNKFQLNFDYTDRNSSMNFTYRYRSSITYNNRISAE